jgi:D-amino-acid dehydrogenase
MKTIAVLGAGITGVTTAYALQERGFAVSLIDRQRYAAMETSFANGGQLSASNAEVWNSVATIIKGLKWMLKPDAPLLVNPKPSWHKYSWMAEFIGAIPQHRANTIETTRMAIASRGHFLSWAQKEGIAFDPVKRGILHIYRDKKSYDSAAKVTEMLKAGGLERRAVTNAEMHAIEPTLAGTYYGGFYTESDFTGDIHKYSAGLAEAIERRGARMLFETDIVTVKAENGGVTLTLSHDNIERIEHFDGVVVCAGVGSRAIARQLGDRVNIYPVKGYSITVNLPDEESQRGAPMVSLLDDETKIVSSRLGRDRLRVAGTAEFNGYNRDITDMRIRPLTRWVRECFPTVSTENVVPWAGLRPMMPNMMPRVAPGKAPGVFYNTGHGHLGWTLCAATAEIIAAQVQAAARSNSGATAKAMATKAA